MFLYFLLALALTAAEQLKALVHRADPQLIALFKVIRRVDGEHHHIDQAGVENAVGDLRRVR